MAPVMAVILTQALDREMTVGPKLLTGDAKDLQMSHLLVISMCVGLYRSF